MAYLMSGTTRAEDHVYTQASNVAAPAAVTVGAALTDNSGGTANTTIQDVEASYTEDTLANNFADLTARCNELRADVIALRTTVANLVAAITGTGKAMAS